MTTTPATPTTRAPANAENCEDEDNAGDGDGSWTETGPRLSTTSITSTPRTPGTWAAGASPGGLWHTRDAGEHWQQAGHFKHVRVVLAPEEI